MFDFYEYLVKKHFISDVFVESRVIIGLAYYE